MSILLFTGTVFLTSCSEDKLDESIPLNPVLAPFKAVTAADGPVVANATISDKDRTIEFEFLNLKNLKEVKVNLHVSKRAKLLAPIDTVLTLDLTKPYEITINNLYDDITYTLSASIPEFIPADKSKFNEYRLNNDGAPEEGDIKFLWDGGIMSKPNNYDEIGYRNYLTKRSFTIDIGHRYDGSYYDIKQFKASLYWPYSNVCPKVYELWGYMSPGEPPISGDWANWTKLGTMNNSSSTLANFGEGDNIHFDKEESPQARYFRVRLVENYRSDTFISLCEVSFWAWNK
ncbi:MAG: DUF5000 domain-containing lipoprotein [Dysgonamonadaceae bacterium]